MTTPCVACEQTLPRTSFSKNQLEKKVGTRMCKACVLRKYPSAPGAQSAAGVHAAPPTAAASPTGGVVGGSIECIDCKRTLPRSSYSKNQLEKKVGTRRCGTCVAPQVHSPSAAKHSPPPTLVPAPPPLAR